MDLAVIGGGIAGLWILDAAVRAGRNAILVEAFVCLGGFLVEPRKTTRGRPPKKTVRATSV